MGKGEGITMGRVPVSKIVDVVEFAAGPLAMQVGFATWIDESSVVIC